MSNGPGSDHSGPGSQTNIDEAKAPVLSGQFQGSVSVQYQATPEKLIIPHQIPLPPADFTGRDEELQNLVSRFRPGAAGVSLHGMGGVGKTALAFALAERIKDTFPDGHLYINMRGTDTKPLSFAEAMAQVIRTYAPTLRLPESEAELANLYRSVLDGKSALLLLDNALDDRQVRPLLPPAKCSLIVTSRRKFKLPGILAKDLEVLKLNKAVELLFKMANADSSDVELKKDGPWKELARLCGCLPVALRAAGSFLANTPDSSPERYVRELRDESTRLERIGKEGVEEDVDLELRLSYSRLAPETARVLKVLSIFPADFDSMAEEAVCQDEGHKHLSDLVRWCMVEYQRPEAEGEGRYHLHDLVRLFASGQLKEEENAAVENDFLQRHAEYYKNALSSANELYERGDMLAGLARFDLERANIYSGLSWVNKNFEGSYSAASLYNAYFIRPRLLQLRMLPIDLLLWLEPSVAAARKVGDRKMEGAHLGDLGVAHYNLGNFTEAEKHFEQALAIARETGDKKNEGVWLGNLGIIEANLNPQKAIEYFEMALKVCRDTGNRREEGSCLDSMGSALTRLGDTRRAIEYFEQALAIARETGDKKNEGACLGNLGCAEANLNIQKAIEYFEKALAVAREVGDLRIEEKTLHNLSFVYADLGEKLKANYYREQELASSLNETSKAIDCFEQLLTMACRIKDRKEKEEALVNLGNTYFELGEIDKTIECFEQCLINAREIGDRRAVSRWLNDLANTYRDHLGNARKAIEYYDQSLAIARENGDLKREGETLASLGIAYADLGDKHKAADYNKQYLTIIRETGDRNAEIQALIRLGMDYNYRGEARIAIEYFEQYLDVSREIGDREGEANALFNMSLSFDKLGQRNKAIDFAKSALEIFNQIESPSAEWINEKLTQWQGDENPK